MRLREKIANYLLKEVKPLDEKYIQALFRNMLRSGTIMEIDNNAESYITNGYQGNADVYSIIRRYITMSAQAKLR